MSRRSQRQQSPAETDPQAFQRQEADLPSNYNQEPVIEEQQGDPYQQAALVQQETNLPVDANLLQTMLIDAQKASGFENMNSEDIALPYLSLLQSGSPEVKMGPEKIEGACEGDFINTLTKEIYKGPIYIIPCAYVKAYPEYNLRENGGGFVAQHDNPDVLKNCTEDEKHRMITPNGTQIVTTAYHYCIHMLPNGAGTNKVVMGLSSTQLKKSRRWNSQMMALSINIQGRKVTPPTYSHIYACNSVVDTNEHGSWVLYDFGSPKMVSDPIVYEEAKKFHDDVNKNIVKVNPVNMEEPQPAAQTNHNHF